MNEQYINILERIHAAYYQLSAAERKVADYVLSQHAHVQIMSIAEGCEIPFRRYFAVKLLQGLCCAALTALWLTAADPLPASPTNTAVCLSVQRPYYGVLTFIFVVTAAVMRLVRLLHRLSGGTKTKKTCK